jgi:ribosomal RNA-processing protein 12
VLYGSESDVEDSEADEPTMPRHGGPNQKPAKAGKKGKSQIDTGTRLRVDDDQPMDLLEGAAGNVMSMHLSPISQRYINFTLISVKI